MMKGSFRPTASSVSVDTRKNHGIIKKGGSLRHASPITHDGVDEKTASSLRILKAELQSMREQDEAFAKRLKSMDVALKELSQICFTPTPVTPRAGYFFNDAASKKSGTGDPERNDSPTDVSGADSDASQVTYSNGDDADKSNPGSGSSDARATDVSDMSVGTISPPLLSGGESSCDVDSVFGSPIAKPFNTPGSESQLSAGAVSDTSPIFSPLPRECSARSAFPIPTSLPRENVKRSEASPLDDAQTPLLHQAVSGLHKPLEFSPSFGEASFLSNLKDDSLMGEDLIAMFNEKSDAVKKELGLSQSSLASSSPKGNSPAPDSLGAGSPQPPRSASCTDFRTSPRPESPLVREGTLGKVRRTSGNGALNSAVAYLYPNPESISGRPSPAPSPQFHMDSASLNMKALLGQSTPTIARQSPDVPPLPGVTPARVMAPRNSTGSLRTHAGTKERLCRKPAHMDDSDQPRSNSFSVAQVQHGHWMGVEAAEAGPSDAERGDLLSPLRRGSKGWYVGQQEEQFLRGRLVTSPPGMVKSDDAAERTSTTPTICSQKYNRQLSFDLTSTTTIHVDNFVRRHSTGTKKDSTKPTDTSSSATMDQLLDDSNTSDGHRQESNLVSTSHLSLSSSSLSSKKSTTSVSKFFGNLVRGQKKPRSGELV